MRRFAVIDCQHTRPGRCPRSACRYHQPGARDGCALAQAELGPMSLRAIGTMLGLTWERIRQIEAQALSRVSARLRRYSVDLEDALRGAETRPDSARTWPEAGDAGLTTILRKRGAGSGRQGLRDLPQRRHRPQDAPEASAVDRWALRRSEPPGGR